MCVPSRLPITRGSPHVRSASMGPHGACVRLMEPSNTRTRTQWSVPARVAARLLHGTCAAWPPFVQLACTPCPCPRSSTQPCSARTCTHQQPSSPTHQQPGTPTHQQPGTPTAQQPSNPAAQQPKWPVDQRAFGGQRCYTVGNGVTTLYCLLRRTRGPSWPRDACMANQGQKGQPPPCGCCLPARELGPYMPVAGAGSDTSRK